MNIYFRKRIEVSLNISMIGISYQYYNQKAISADCIYRKIHKKSKRQTPEKGFALTEKQYHK
jgi:hypothetical protein